MNSLIEPVKIELLISDPKVAKACVKTIFDDDLSTMNQFIIDDVLVHLATSLLVLDLFAVDRNALCSLRYKVQPLLARINEIVAQLT